MNDENRGITIVIGHKNPDTDSIASAAAYAKLKFLQGMENVIPASAGVANERTEFIFNKFAVTLPKVMPDITPKIRDIMETNPIFIETGHTLLEAMELLQKHEKYRIPVIDSTGTYTGMVNMFEITNRIFKLPLGESQSGNLLGRKVRSSINFITRVLDGEKILAFEDEVFTTLNVYVAAMSLSSFKDHISENNPKNLAIVVSDREDIQFMAAGLSVKLLIITGNSKISDHILDLAKERGTSIIRTEFDSATTVRRLKFSTPVEFMLDNECEPLKRSSTIKSVRNKVMISSDDLFPVVNSKNKLKGTLSKSDFSKATNYIKLILVDHNEPNQYVTGADEATIIEILDHHRLNIPPTNHPFTVYNDIVGSTCTLVTEKYRSAMIDPPPEIAGILLGGIISDTLLLKSPTATLRDANAIKWLEQLSNTNAENFAAEIFATGSVIASEEPRKVLTSDKKNYEIATCKFSVAQIEETSFEKFEEKFDILVHEAKLLINEEKLNFYGLLVTNVPHEVSYLLAVGDEKYLDRIPYLKIKENLYDLPGILSRKKQLLPQLLNDFELPIN